MQLITKLVTEVEGVVGVQTKVSTSIVLYSIFSCLATTGNVHHLSNNKVTIQLVEFSHYALLMFNMLAMAEECQNRAKLADNFPQGAEVR